MREKLTQLTCLSKHTHMYITLTHTHTHSHTQTQVHTGILSGWSYVKA